VTSDGSSSTTTAVSYSVTLTGSCISSVTAAAAVAATDDHGASSRNTAITCDTTQMYSMVPLHTLLQVRGEPTVDAAVAAAAVAVSSSGSKLQLPSV
jgi:hypothetical protein